MKKAIVIIVSFLILIQSMQIKPIDVLSIDDLFVHINEHLNEGNNIFEFYNLHFGKEAKDHIPKDCNHNQLPFHHQFDSNHVFLSHTFMPLKNSDNTDFYPKKTASFYYINHYFFIAGNTLIQPPIL